jgi:hypothetical protein
LQLTEVSAKKLPIENELAPWQSLIASISGGGAWSALERTVKTVCRRAQVANRKNAALRRWPISAGVPAGGRRMRGLRDVVRAGEFTVLPEGSASSGVLRRLVHQRPFVMAQRSCARLTCDSSAGHIS